MIEIKTFDEKEENDGLSYETEIHIEGQGALVVDQLVNILDHIYKNQPKLFVLALLMCKYTKDHT